MTMFTTNTPIATRYSIRAARIQSGALEALGVTTVTSSLKV